MKEIHNAKLYFDENLIIGLDYPELKDINGELMIECYIINKNHGYESDAIYIEKLQEELGKRPFIIKAITSQGSTIIFKDIYLKSSSFPSFRFTFICLDHYNEYILCDENQKIGNFHLSSFVIEGLEVLFTNSTEVERKRTMFGVEEKRFLSFNLDNSELVFSFWSKKRFYDLKIGLIEDSTDAKSIMVKFYGDNVLPFRIYNLFKNSLKYFISYLAGNNIIIREETFTVNHTYYISKTYSGKKHSALNKNQFLPIFDVHFKHKGILQDYMDTMSNYLFLDKKLNLSEIIYLINQSKQVNIESSFFILLIAIEKLSNNLIKSDLIKSNNNFCIDNEIFKELKPKLIKELESVFKNKVSSKELAYFKTKLGNFNIKNKTDNKIDILLDFCEITRNENIDLLFPKLRNLAIHEGEISFMENDSYKNYHTLFILINSIICNLIQYKGVRFIEHKNGTTYISKKEDYIIDYQNYS